MLQFRAPSARQTSFTDHPATQPDLRRISEASPRHLRRISVVSPDGQAPALGFQEKHYTNFVQNLYKFCTKFIPIFFGGRERGPTAPPSSTHWLGFNQSTIGTCDSPILPIFYQFPLWIPLYQFSANFLPIFYKFIGFRPPAILPILYQFCTNFVQILYKFLTSQVPDA